MNNQSTTRRHCTHWYFSAAPLPALPPVRYLYIVDGSGTPSPVPSFGNEGMQIESELKN
ncbi:hypothetical protein [Rhodococcus sp. 1168]|uniref:hypothetical protein n=1 Tax=Rhodococcus sp. 1168 TaxID=2018041 RepID=UPI0015939326|nr:hypothetical protein [Rhodococcus sp. 1168]